jgi:hypothetical protein
MANLKRASLIVTSQVPGQNAGKTELLNKAISNVRLLETILYAGKMRTRKQLAQFEFLAL